MEVNYFTILYWFCQINFWPFACLLWRNFCLSPLLIFQLGVSFFFLTLLLSCRRSFCVLLFHLWSRVWCGNIAFHSVSCLFIVICLLCRSFAVPCSPICLMLLLLLAPLADIQEIITKSSAVKCFPCVLFQKFCSFSFKSFYLGHKVKGPTSVSFHADT